VPALRSALGLRLSGRENPGIGPHAGLLLEQPEHRLSPLPGLRLHGHWRGINTGDDGRRRIAVNLRLAEPEAVAGIVIDHFDGLQSFADLPRDGRCVADMWF
jgi:hypothetical protein